MTVSRTDWTRAALEAEGFVGWVPLLGLRRADVPRERGVYLVWREAHERPEFLQTSVSGRHKGTDQTIPAGELNGDWIEGASVVYIGLAGGPKAPDRTLADRIGEYAAAGRNVTSSHSGGREIWQLPDHRDVLVAWRSTGPDDPGDVEAELIDDFKEFYGARPFANRQDGRRPHRGRRGA